MKDRRPTGARPKNSPNDPPTPCPTPTPTPNSSTNGSNSQSSSSQSSVDVAIDRAELESLKSATVSSKRTFDGDIETFVTNNSLIGVESPVVVSVLDDISEMLGCSTYDDNYDNAISNIDRVL